jgi:hypothetical protein
VLIYSLTLTAAFIGCATQAPPDTGGLEETTPEVTPVDDLSFGALSLTALPHEEIGSLIVVRWTQTGVLEGHIAFQEPDGEWLITPALSVVDGELAEAILIGIPFETELTWRFEGTLDGVPVTSESHDARTEPLPEGLPIPDLLVADPTAWVEGDRYLLTSINAQSGGWTGGTYWKVILDRQGRILWALKTPDDNWSIFLRVSQDGTHILWDEATYWSQFDAGEAGQVHRMTLDGTIIESISTPGLHHAFVELSDGTLVWGAADLTTETLRRRPPGGEFEDFWTCSDSFSVEYCQSNTLYWNEATDTYLYSFYTNSSVIEVDQSGETLHYWGQNPEWSFEPSSSQFSWQHGVHYLPDGHLLLSTHTTVGELETVVREFAVNEETNALEEVWSFGVGEGIHATTAGEAHRLDNGNTLHNYGSSAHLREVNSAGEIVWEVDWSGNRLLGRSVFLEDLYNYL